VGHVVHTLDWNGWTVTVLLLAGEPWAAIVPRDGCGCDVFVPEPPKLTYDLLADQLTATPITATDLAEDLGHDRGKVSTMLCQLALRNRAERAGKQGRQMLWVRPLDGIEQTR
jgi:hypothetical protein